VIGEKAKIKSAMVIHVIRINLNRSNKRFTYQNMYLKSVAMQCSGEEGMSSVINGGEMVEYVIRKNVSLYNEFWTDLFKPVVDVERMIHS
jgi:hypothetical protein